ncbi:MDR family MFS transporter [Bacillus horti]|uniref:EmrB/QacA subfamily drug resistance transporter n=1 Tax=Caldalkalibacillus horti TaxID=77523 RepID=A0ABT9W3R2_9BACI|nr:MDR family MFS transporter [Bacillus horti]MDQ0167883.1 EmrB/QacA subfamily drug resistance transporter [Bacillus horti]
MTDEQPFTIRSIMAPLIAVVVGMIMVILDSTIVNVAFPKFQQEFNSSLSVVQWTFTGYTLALSAVIPLAGWMTDKFGTKRVFLTTIVLFTLGSVLCAMAQTIEQLIIFRIIQGLGGGMVAPIGMAIIYRLAPPHKVGAVMGVLGVPILIAPALGPVLSGWIIDYVSWHWIFLINLPIGIIAIAIGIRYLPVFPQGEAPRLDFLGMLLAPLAFSMLAFGVNEGAVDWTSTRTIIAITIGIATLIGLIVTELRHKQPLLELRVFRSSDFRRGILLLWLVQITLFGIMVLFPVYLQTVRGYSPLDTGLIMLVQAVGSIIFTPIGGRFFDKVGARPLALIGLTIISGALFWLTQVSLDTQLLLLLLPLFMIGSGMGLIMMALNTHVLNSAPRHLVGRVTSLTTAAQHVVTSFAVAGLTGFLALRTNGLTENVEVESIAVAYSDTFLLTAILSAVGVVLSLLLRKPKMDPNHSVSGTESTIN